MVEFLRKLSQQTAICSAEGAFALPLRQGRVRAVPACRSTTDGHEFTPLQTPDRESHHIDE